MLALGTRSRVGVYRVIITAVYRKSSFKLPFVDLPLTHGQGRVLQQLSFPVPPIMLAKMLAKINMGLGNFANPLFSLVGRRGLEPQT